MTLRPTYVGVVRATQEEPSALRTKMMSLLAEGETANQDFKRELNVGSDAAKAELVRDVLALANAQLSGSRYLIIGIADDGMEFADAPADLTRDRIEQIVQAWAPPAPPVKAFRVRLATCEVLLIEVGRNPLDLPYRANKGAGKLRPGVIYSRHGTHTEQATEAEAASIRDEGERARARRRDEQAG